MNTYQVQTDSTITVQDAWDLFIGNEQMTADFLAQGIRYNWPEQYRNLSQTSYWAYWFARNVIADHWPDGEHLIQVDQEVWNVYQDLLAFYKSSKLLGSTTAQRQYTTNSNGLIVGKTDNVEPTCQRTSVTSVSDLVSRSLKAMAVKRVVNPSDDSDNILAAFNDED